MPNFLTVLVTIRASNTRASIEKRSSEAGQVCREAHRILSPLKGQACADAGANPTTATGTKTSRKAAESRWSALDAASLRRHLVLSNFCGRSCGALSRFIGTDAIRSAGRSSSRTVAARTSVRTIPSNTRVGRSACSARNRANLIVRRSAG